MIRSALALASLLAVAGCHRAPRTGPASDYERESVFALTEAQDLWRCAPEATHVERSGYARYLMSGCNVTHAYVCNWALQPPQCFADDEGEYGPPVDAGVAPGQ